jgi:hypothetical protein
MMTSLACVWVFRKTLLASARNFLLRGLCFRGLAGSSFALVLVAALIEFANPSTESMTVFGIGGVAVIGVVATVVGVPLMVLIRNACLDFFAGRRIARGSVPLGGTRSCLNGA